MAAWSPAAGLDQYHSWAGVYKFQGLQRHRTEGIEALAGHRWAVVTHCDGLVAGGSIAGYSVNMFSVFFLINT